MAPYDDWFADVRAWIGHVGRTTLYAVVTDKGLIHAEAMPPGKDEVDAAIDVVVLLRHHPDLNRVGVNFGSNNRQLQELVRADRNHAGAHVEALPDSAMFYSDALMLEAREAALDCVGDLEPRPVRVLRAATDGAKDKGNPRAKRKVETLDRTAGADKARPRAGWGWVTETGEFDFGHIEAATSREAELRAIERLLSSVDPRVELVIEVDSTEAIKLAEAALAGQTPETTRKTQTVLRDIRRHAGRPVTFEWVKGHAGARLNELADRLAQFGRTGEDLYRDPELVYELARRNVAESLMAEAV